MQTVFQIVDRQHVGLTNRQVLREVVRCMRSRVSGRKRIQRGLKVWQTIPRATRREIMRAAFKRHEDNLRVYCQVMSGRL